MVTPGEYLRSVLRVFPDYAGTVLWFVSDPVRYERAQLTPQLEADLNAWETRYYGGLTPELHWRPEFDIASYDSDGVSLCERLASELGDLVGVEYHGYRDGAKTVVIRGTGRGSNPQARAAFERMIAESLTEEARLGDSVKGAAWTAYVPVNRHG